MRTESPLIPRWYFARHSFQYNFLQDTYFPRRFNSNTMYRPRQQFPIWIFSKKNYSKNTISKTEKYQNKLKPRHFAFKTKFFHDIQISSLFFAKICLGKNLSLKFTSWKKATCFDISYLGINILGVLSVAKIYIRGCCQGWYIALEPSSKVPLKCSNCGKIFNIVL